MRGFLMSVDRLRISTLRKMFGEKLADEFGKNQSKYGFGFCDTCNWYSRSALGRGVCDSCLERREEEHDG